MTRNFVSIEGPAHEVGPAKLSLLLERELIVACEECTRLQRSALGDQTSTVYHPLVGSADTPEAAYDEAETVEAKIMEVVNASTH